MRTKQIVTLLLISLLSFSQNYQVQSVQIGLGYGPNCGGSGFGCDFLLQTNAAETAANAKVSYDKEHHELLLIFDHTKLNFENKSKLLDNKLENNYYLYVVEQDFTLPVAVLEALTIEGIGVIKKGNYLVKVFGNQISIKLKLK